MEAVYFSETLVPAYTQVHSLFLVPVARLQKNAAPRGAVVSVLRTAMAQISQHYLLLLSGIDLN
jgi:hypothetical protein